MLSPFNKYNFLSYNNKELQHLNFLFDFSLHLLEVLYILFLFSFFFFNKLCNVKIGYHDSFCNLCFGLLLLHEVNGHYLKKKPEYKKLYCIHKLTQMDGRDHRNIVLNNECVVIITEVQSLLGKTNSPQETNAANKLYW